MPDVTHVLAEKYKGMDWSLNGSPTTEEEFNSGFTIHNSNGVTKPTWSKLQSYLKIMQAEYEALAYSRSRKKEYNALNQFELISDDSINGTTTHKDAILAIKKKYPKK
jgi:hypothetical protein